MVKKRMGPFDLRRDDLLPTKRRRLPKGGSQFAIFPKWINLVWELPSSYLRYKKTKDINAFNGGIEAPFVFVPPPPPPVVNWGWEQPLNHIKSTVQRYFGIEGKSEFAGFTGGGGPPPPPQVNVWGWDPVCGII